MTMIKQLFAALAFAASGAGFAADGHGSHSHEHDHKPLHGGVVVEANDIDFELVAKAESLTLHLRGHGKPVNTQGATARLTLLNGTEKSEAMLAPAGNGKLEARGSFKVGSGTKAVALVTLPGSKPVNVRFAFK